VSTNRPRLLPFAPIIIAWIVDWFALEDQSSPPMALGSQSNCTPDQIYTAEKDSHGKELDESQQRKIQQPVTVIYSHRSSP
jgi:hypothetical protein